MSNNLIKPHATMALLTSLTISAASLAAGAGVQTITEHLETNKIIEKIVLRVRADFGHGEVKAKEPKFGGIYNLIKSAGIKFNAGDSKFLKSGMALYVDAMKRTGREKNDLNYADLPDAHTQEIDYCFYGNETIAGGTKIANGAFALDLRHSAAEGVNTFNSVALVLELNDISAIFSQVNDTAFENVTIDVFAVQVFHDEQSRKALAVNGARYAQAITETQWKKIADETLINEFNLPAIGKQSNGVNLSDLTIVQTDGNGMAVPFDDENAVVSVKVAGNDFYSYPVWAIRAAQNARRLQPIPPNVLLIPLVQTASGLGGLSPIMLEAGVKLCVKANKLDGQDTETCLHVEKTYSQKIFA